MSARYTSIEIKIGLFLAFSCALFIGLLGTFGKLARMWGNRQQLHVVFENASGIMPDSPVRYNGKEVGRVKSLQAVHFDEKNLSRLPLLRRSDLDNLPIWQQPVRRALMDAAPEDFDKLAREALVDRTMIELRLELQELDHYHVDDTIRIISSLLGDTAVEIYSGSGRIESFGSNHLLIGTSGDFFSNLSKGVGEVREILSSVGDIVGPEERKVLSNNQARSTEISKGLNSISDTARKRTEQTKKLASDFSKDASAKFDEMSKAVDKIKPDAQRVSKDVNERFTAIKEKIEATQKEISKSTDEIAADARAVRDQIKPVIDASREDFKKVREQFNSASEQFGKLSERIGSARDTAGMLVANSEEDLARGTKSLKSALNALPLIGFIANEHKDLMLSNKDVGEHVYATAQIIFRDISNAARNFRAIIAETQEAQNAAGVDATARASALEDVRRKLIKLQKPVEAARDRVEEKMLPPYERKRAAWAGDKQE